MDREILVKRTTKVVFKPYVDQWRGEIFCLVKAYFDASGDKAATPGAVMLDIAENTGKPGYLLIIHEEEGIPAGFLMGKLIGKTARILMAFLGKGLDNPAIIKEAMGLFESWAKENNCTAGDLYTHRHPKSYRSLEKDGWKHLFTVYRKELIP